jgi:hypothetical protein
MPFDAEGVDLELLLELTFGVMAGGVEGFMAGSVEGFMASGVEGFMAGGVEGLDLTAGELVLEAWFRLPAARELARERASESMAGKRTGAALVPLLFCTFGPEHEYVLRGASGGSCSNFCISVTILGNNSPLLPCKWSIPALRSSARSTIVSNFMMVAPFDNAVCNILPGKPVVSCVPIIKSTSQASVASLTLWLP